jgi:hypothetical protein
MADVIKIDLKQPIIPNVPDVAVVGWKGKMVAICHNMEQVEFMFQSTFVQMVLCIDVPNCKYVTSVVEAWRFYVDGDDNGRT